MSAAVTLFDNGITRATLRAHEPPAERLVVTFSCLHSTDVEAPGWGEDFLWEEGFDVLSVKPRLNQWFQDLSLEDIADRIMAGLSYKEVLTYGTSMGAYAAAYFAAAIKPKRAILFSPQHSVDPTVSGWDERWKDYWSIPFAHRPMAEAASPTTDYVVFYDPWTPDGRHVEEVAAAVGPRNIRRIRVPLSGHEAITTMHDAGVLSSLVLALMRDSEDFPALVSQLTRKRKQTWLYAYHLFFRAFYKHRSIADRTLALEIYRRAGRLNQRILSLEPLLVLRAWDDAVQIIGELGEITLGESRWVDGAVASVDGAIRGLDNRAAQELLSPLWAKATFREGENWVTVPPPVPPPPTLRKPSTYGVGVVDYLTDESPPSGAQILREFGEKAKGLGRLFRR